MSSNVEVEEKKSKSSLLLSSLTKVPVRKEYEGGECRGRKRRKEK